MPRMPSPNARMQDSLVNAKVITRRVLRLERLEQVCADPAGREQIRLDRQQLEAGLYSYLTYMHRGLSDLAVAEDSWSRRYGHVEPSVRQLRLIAGGLADDKEPEKAA